MNRRAVARPSNLKYQASVDFRFRSSAPQGANVTDGLGGYCTGRTELGAIVAQVVCGPMSAVQCEKPRWEFPAGFGSRTAENKPGDIYFVPRHNREGLVDILNR